MQNYLEVTEKYDLDITIRFNKHLEDGYEITVEDTPIEGDLKWDLSGSKLLNSYVQLAESEKSLCETKLLFKKLLKEFILSGKPKAQIYKAFNDINSKSQLEREIGFKGFREVLIELAVESEYEDMKYYVQTASTLTELDK